MTMMDNQINPLSYYPYGGMKTDVKEKSRRVNEERQTKYTEESDFRPKRLLEEAHETVIVLNEVFFEKSLPLNTLYTPSNLKGIALLMFAFAIVLFMFSALNQ
jgi:hypothetical protein